MHIIPMHYRRDISARSKECSEILSVPPMIRASTAPILIYKRFARNPAPATSGFLAAWSLHKADYRATPVAIGAAHSKSFILHEYILDEGVFRRAANCH
ncbi:hypothetical protein SAMN04488026_112411 [Aliiruegeria lutimaris]|uniref:Uncharacterized protein n=1 Tax=Aliiruegeria lutimaris TaxID=571298 RepID=A0A1G9NLR0_9RHOB|nr:hypothetical protein SAMN04488026_112411 [Aliiruegeria lutimaris]